MDRLNDYDLLVFDFDGTLVDSIEGVLASFNYALSKYGYPKLKKDDIRKKIGLPLEDIALYTLKVSGINEKDDIDIEKFLSFYREFYKREGYKLASLYDGISDFLEKAKSKNKKLAIFTNRSIDSTTQILEIVGVANLFDVVVSGETINKRKPLPDGLLMIMEKIGQREKETIMIGDSIIDINTALNANIDSCFVTYGYGSGIDDADKKATFYIDSFAKF